MTLKPAFQDEIARVKRNEAHLQEVYAARLHAGDANRAVDTAKVALADAVIAAGGAFIRDDLVRAVLHGIAFEAGIHFDDVVTDHKDHKYAERIVAEMLGEKP